jgi:tellurite resistance protein TehA-like permease
MLLKMERGIIEGLVNTAIGYTTTLVITLQDVNVIIAMVVGLTTTIYLICKIIKTIKEIKK